MRNYFGSNGQDDYLNQLLNNLNFQVINVSRSNAAICGNVKDYNFVQMVIKENNPDYVFHFAAISSTKHEFLFENHETISTGTINILESVKLFSQMQESSYLAAPCNSRMMKSQ